MKKDNTSFYLAFSSCLGIGPVTFDRLLSRFETVEQAYHAPKSVLEGIVRGEAAEQLFLFQKKINPRQRLKEIQGKGITVISRENGLYPSALRNIPDPPICLYVKGDIRAFQFGKRPVIAVVGTRNPTPYGREVAIKLTTQLVEQGFCIVSGMALGIDAIAHRSALQTGGQTIAVLGCGVDLPYPPANKPLYDEIQKKGGIVVYEYPPGHIVHRGFFVARNRIVSGLSQGVLVIEGQRDSGALITARYAAEQGKDVFAPPAPITSNMSEAPNILLKEGAKVVTSVDDILEEFHMKKRGVGRKTQGELSANEKAVAEALREREKTIDDLMPELQMPVYELLQTLSALELKGAVEKTTEGTYRVLF